MSSPPWLWPLVLTATSGTLSYAHGAFGAYLAETNHSAFSSWAGSVSTMLAAVTFGLGVATWFVYYTVTEYEARVRAARELERCDCTKPEARNTLVAESAEVGRVIECNVEQSPTP